MLQNPCKTLGYKIMVYKIPSGGGQPYPAIGLSILRDFKNAPFYILCLFHMIDLRMFSLLFLSSCKMDHDLP